MENVSWKDVLHYGSAVFLFAMGGITEMGVHLPGIQVDPTVCFATGAGIFASGLKGGVTSGAVKSLIFALAVGFGLSFAFPANAAAQTTTSLSPTAVAQKIQQLVAPDVAYAIQLAKAVNTPQGNVRAQCYQAIQNAIPVPPAGSTMPPAPHLVTNVEQLAEVIDALQPNGPLFVNCGGAAQLVQQNVLVFINAVVTGFLGATKAIPLIAAVP